MDIRNKLLLKKNLQQVRNRKIVLSAGCFDVISFAHIRHLQWAAQQGDILVVAITSDAHVTRHKGEGKPVFSHHHRAEQVAALNCVDHVVINRADSVLPIIQELQPNVYVKGDDTKKDPSDYFGEECAAVKKYGGVVLFSPCEQEHHTTQIMREITRTL